MSGTMLVGPFDSLELYCRWTMLVGLFDSLGL